MGPLVLLNALSALCPMHALLDADGIIIGAGPTLRKLRPDYCWAGLRFLDIIEVMRPRSTRSVDALFAAAGSKLRLRFRDSPHTTLQGVLVAAPCTNCAYGGGGAIVNLSFGISIVEAVRDYALSSADFAATDMTVEMLYLIEAKSAAMEASRQLNLRLQGARIAAEEQAYTDTLTGLKNRRALDHILSRRLSRRDRLAIMQLDLDGFKAVNDSLGHAAGDHVLQHVARAMVEETRKDDTVVRVGGDEFVLVLGDIQERRMLDEIARRIIARVELPMEFEGHQCRISVSIGTVLSDDYDKPDATDLLADADIALYASKHRGRACHTFYSRALRDDPAIAAPPAGRA